jgi:hypothetical protein
LNCIDGELIQQQNPEKVFTGEGRDKVGPGHYEAKREAAVKKSGTNWHSSKVQKGLKIESHGNAADIGPGKYELGKTQPIPQYKLRGMSCFVSGVPKVGSESRKEETQSPNKVEDNEEEEEEEDIDVFLMLITIL